MTMKIGINGFGRIGRNFFRAAKQQGADFDFVAVNDLTDASTLAHLLKYDSVLGTLRRRRGRRRRRPRWSTATSSDLAERDPATLPWKELGAEIVVESTGLFTDRGEGRRSTSRPARRRSSSAPPPRERTSRS